MCTVSFIPQGKSGFVLTSNRDEAPIRDTLSPDFYKIDNTNMLFPKDKRAGGTWIGISDKQRLVCLLNGGFMLHERQAKYRLSRGVVVKHMMATENIKDSVENYDLHDIEPFTLVIVEWQPDMKLYEFVWDGDEKHFSDLALKSRLWSSSSLYNSQMKVERQQWFSQFLDNDDLSAKAILDFHTSAGKDNDDFGVVMDRGFVKTTSITQIEKSDDSVSMRYHELNSDVLAKVNFEIPESISE